MLILFIKCLKVFKGFYIKKFNLKFFKYYYFLFLFKINLNLKTITVIIDLEGGVVDQLEEGQGLLKDLRN